MIQPHEIDFSKFIKNWTLEGSRSYFEDFVYEFLRIKHQNVEIKKTRPNHGDWGIDAICGDLANFNIIWQCKFFPDKIGDAQKIQIRSSYNTVIKKSKEKQFKIYKWILCIPINFHPEELKWWNKWKKKMQIRDDIIIDSLILSNFKEKCKDPQFQNLLRYYFREEDLLKPHPELIEDHINEDSVFINHIKNSDISVNLKDIKKQFFYADYFEKDIEQKESKYEIQQLNTIYDELYVIWEANHNNIYFNRNDDDGNDLLNKLREYLMNNFSYFRQRLNNITISILFGLLYKLSDRKIIYWTRNR